VVCLIQRLREDTPVGAATRPAGCVDKRPTVKMEPQIQDFVDLIDEWFSDSTRLTIEQLRIRFLIAGLRSRLCFGEGLVHGYIPAMDLSPLAAAMYREIVAFVTGIMARETDGVVSNYTYDHAESPEAPV